MLGLRICRSTSTRTISNGFHPPGAAVTRRVTPEIYRLVTANQHLSCLPLQRSPLLLDQYQDFNPRKSLPNAMYHWSSPSQSLLLPSRLTSPRLLPSFSNSVFTKSSIRVCFMPRPFSRRTHATVHEPYTTFLQPLDPSCRRQSIRRGFIISLPILIIYLLLYLLYLLGLVLHRNDLGRYYLDTVGRFWTYQRQQGLRNAVSLCTFVTSQFTHIGLTSLVTDSLVLVGIASVLGSVFNRRTFFAVYVLGGFLAAAADCAWANATNPCRSLTQARHAEILTSIRIRNEAVAKFIELRSSWQMYTWKGFFECFTNPKDCIEKLRKDPVQKELGRQQEIILKHSPILRDFVRWTGLNWAASGSLICLSMLPIH